MGLSVFRVVDGQARRASLRSSTSSAAVTACAPRAGSAWAAAVGVCAGGAVSDHWVSHSALPGTPVASGAASAPGSMSGPRRQLRARPPRGQPWPPGQVRPAQVQMLHRARPSAAAPAAAVGPAAPAAAGPASLARRRRTGRRTTRRRRTGCCRSRHRPSNRQRCRQKCRKRCRCWCLRRMRNLRPGGSCCGSAAARPQRPPR